MNKEVKKKRRNNKAAGNRTELYFLKKLENIHKQKLFTTRNISTLSDAKKNDIDNENLNLPIKYQIKQSINNPNYSQILTEMSNNYKEYINVIAHQKTAKKGDKFYKVDDYVIMKFEDYEKIIKAYLESL